MFLAQFEGSPETLLYKEGKLTNSSPPINAPRKVSSLTFSVNGIRTESNYFIANDSPDYPKVKGKNYLSKEYGEFLASLGFLVLPRSNNPGVLPDSSLMQRFVLVGWTDGESFMPYSQYTGKLICKSIDFSIKDGILIANIATDTTQFSTSKYSIYSNAAVGSEILFSNQGELIVVTNEAQSKIKAPVYCPACRRRLEISPSCGDERCCVNTECDDVRIRFIQKLQDLGIYYNTTDLPVEYLSYLNRKDMLKAIFKKLGNSKILNNSTLIQLLEIPDTKSIDDSFPPEYPLAALLTNQALASERLKAWMKTNSKLFCVALDIFETPRRKKVAYATGANSPLSIDSWYEQTSPEKAEAFFYSGKFFLGV